MVVMMMLRLSLVFFWFFGISLNAVQSSKLQYNFTSIHTSVSVSLSARTFKGVPRLRELDRNEERKVYDFTPGQLIILADWGEQRGKSSKLLRCELIEVYNATERSEVFKNLSDYPVIKMNFAKIKDLMDQCDSIDDIKLKNPSPAKWYNIKVIIGLLPGTKWCGNGDSAESFHDLGEHRNVDRCCRMHDLCPIKILGRDTKYNLTNPVYTTRSHCDCDKRFYDCIKDSPDLNGHLIRLIYFYIVNPECIGGDPDSPNSNPMHFAPQILRLDKHSSDTNAS